MVPVLSNHLTKNNKWCIILPSASSVGREVNIMDFIIAILTSTIAGVITYYICKWLDKK